MTTRDDSFVAARTETLRYHRELYATTPLGHAGSWLAAPQPSVMRAVAAVGDDRPVVAYDLGAGIGRHTFPMLQAFASGSTVIAVDLLPEALDVLRASAPNTESKLVLVAADLADFELPVPADLIVAFSVIEHLPDLDSIRHLLENLAAATAPGGIVHLGVVCDRFEIDHTGHRRPALLESGISADQIRATVDAVLGGFHSIERSTRTATVVEERRGEQYRLASTLVSFTLRRPISRAIGSTVGVPGA